MAEETNTTGSTESSDIFISVKNILESDSNLCNMSRYMDYGKLTKDPADTYRIIWKVMKDAVNSDLCLNNTQVIRFVDRIDSRFLSMMRVYNSQLTSQSVQGGYFNCRRQVQYMSNNATGARETFDQMLLSNMINIDCTYKVSGASLTALDFVHKNPLNTREEANFFSELGRDITKYIFIGDKCYILALIDRFHNVYVSKKLLQTFQKKDVKNFETIVKRLFKVIGRYCYHVMNTSITQYYMDQIMSPVMLLCANNGKFVKAAKDSDFKKLLTFTFSDDAECNDIVKKNIVATIEKTCKRYIEKYYDFSNLDFPRMIQDMKNNLQDSMKELTKRAYINGLSLSSMFRKYGWNYCDMNEERKKWNRSLHYNPDHVYVCKNIEMVPRLAYMYSNGRYGDGRVYRKLNEDGVQAIQNESYIIMHTLYIDITNGTMLMYGKHPNVSGGGEVCMGDIKGKISFDNCDEETLKDNLDKCEHLLDTINYTSSYMSDGDRIFLDEKYSFNVADECKQEAEKTEAEIDDDLGCGDVCDEDGELEEEAVETEDDGIDDSVDGVEDAE